MHYRLFNMVVKLVDFCVLEGFAVTILISIKELVWLKILQKKCFVKEVT